MDEGYYPHYEPPEDYDAHDEYELSVYYLGDNIGIENTIFVNEIGRRRAE